MGVQDLEEPNSLFNLINHQPAIVQTCLYAKDPYDAKHQLLITKQQVIGLKHLNDSKAFIEYSNDMIDVHENIRRIQSK